MIKIDMEMPKGCWSCPLKSGSDQYYICSYSGKYIDPPGYLVKNWATTGRLKDCPLIEVENGSRLRDFVKYDIAVSFQNNFEISKFLDICKESCLEIDPDIKRTGYVLIFYSRNSVKSSTNVPFGYSTVKASSIFGE